MITEYFGEYAVTSYSGNVVGGGTYTAAATNGCFVMVLEQPVGGSAGQIRRHPLPSVTSVPSPNAFGEGEPNESGLEAETVLDFGALTSFAITNLTPTSGSGSFSFTNSANAPATGTVTITGSESEIASPDALRRVAAQLRARRALVIRAR